MLNKLRGLLGHWMDKLGNVFASSGLSPNFWTALSFVFAVGSALIYTFASPFIGIDWYQSSLGGSIMLLISGFFDMLDGCVARVTKRSSKKGGYLDSVFDKISESVIFIGIALGGLANPIITQVAISLSILVSYTRARSESIGIELKGIGIGERAERLLILGLLGLIPLKGILEYAVILVCIVAGITLCQRIIFTTRQL